MWKGKYYFRFAARNKKAEAGKRKGIVKQEGEQERGRGVGKR
jgi:hypothetical protein